MQGGGGGGGGGNGRRVTNVPFAPIPDDWDHPITEEALEAIDAAVHAASSSSFLSTEERSGPVQGRGARHSRRLPLSLACPGGRSSCSFSLSPCLRNRPLDFGSSSNQAMLKIRRPTINFGGKILYSRTVTEVEKATRELLDMVDAKKSENSRAILGFDIEWRPSFKRGVPPGKVALMQICGDASRCYVMHIFHSGIPQILQSLLEDPTSAKVGVGIAGDSLKVFKEYNVSTQGLEDLSSLANRKFGGDPKKWGLAALVDALISKELKKPNKIKLGNWEANRLSKEQLQYAATDAYASWYTYEELNWFINARVKLWKLMVEEMYQQETKEGGGGGGGSIR